MGHREDLLCIGFTADVLSEFEITRTRLLTDLRLAGSFKDVRRLRSLERARFYNLSKQRLKIYRPRGRQIHALAGSMRKHI